MADVVHRYYLPRIKDADGRELDSWSVWLVDEATGTLVIFGDRGTWSHTWGWRRSDGARDFRSQLLGFCDDDHYLFKKLASGLARVFDADGTRERVRRRIRELRRSGDISGAEARDDWGDAGSIDNIVEFGRFIDDEDRREELYAYSGTYQVHEEGWLRHLIAVTRPRFVVAVRDELDREFRAAAKRGLRDRGDDFWAAARGYRRSLKDEPSWMAAGVVEPEVRNA